MSSESETAADHPAPQPGRRAFRPRLWPTLIALVMFALLMMLANWQRARYYEKTEQLAHYTKQHDELPPVERLSDFDAARDPQRRLELLHFRRARLRGRIDAEQIHLLTARYMLGNRGFGVLAPLQLADEPDRKVLVHLGWVREDRLPGYLELLKRADVRTVEGRLQVADDRDASAEPVGSYEGRPTWRRINAAAIAAEVPGLEPAIVVQAGEQASGDAVDPEQTPLTGYAHPIRMPATKHVEYALTWFGLGLALVAVWLALSFREVSEPTSPRASR